MSDVSSSSDLDQRVDPTAHHVGITVHDLDRAVEFYREVLGFGELDRFTVSGSEFASAIDVEGATGTFAHLDAGGTRLELIEYEPEGESIPTEKINGPGATHLGLSVANIEDFYESLPDAIETLNEPQTTESGSTILFVRDPEDNLVELIET
jgi:catechol 2,3-dioxygenase-like lactoylglutathione lyase family enzyme